MQHKCICLVHIIITCVLLSAEDICHSSSKIIIHTSLTFTFGNINMLLQVNFHGRTLQVYHLLECDYQLCKHLNGKEHKKKKTVIDKIYWRNNFKLRSKFVWSMVYIIISLNTFIISSLFWEKKRITKGQNLNK